MKLLENCCAWYARKVNNANGLTLFLLAIATSTMVVLSLYFSEIPIVTDDSFYCVAFSAFCEALLLGGYIRYRRDRRATVPNPTQSTQSSPPPPPSPYPNLLRFSQSSIYVAAMVFFFFCDGPLKSVNNLYAPGICLFSYLHVLVLLAILRRNEDFGVADGCLAAAFAVLYPKASSSWWKLSLLAVVTLILRGLRNLQHHSSTQSSPLLPVVTNRNNQKGKGKKKSVRSSF